jgi:hypothetical protein
MSEPLNDDRLVSLRLPVETDRETERTKRIKIVGYVETGDIRILFGDEGFIHAGMFRGFYENGEHGATESKGPVTVTTYLEESQKGEVLVSMNVVVRLLQGDGVTVVERELDIDTCLEIIERLDQMTMLLGTYEATPIGRRSSRRPLRAAAQ